MPRPSVSFTLLDPLVRNASMLTTSLQAAWFWSDPPLRAEIEMSIRVLVRRVPALLPIFKTTVRLYQSPKAGLDATAELCGLLLTIWALGDPPLRGEVVAMILSYGQRHPAFGPAFRAAAMAALADPRVIGVAGDRAPAAAELRRLIAQLDGA